MNSEEIRSRIIKYLPDFATVANHSGEVVTTDSLALIFINAVSNAISLLSEEIKGLNSAIFQGKSLRLLCNEIRIFYSTNESDATIQARYQDQFSILQERGTEAGIDADLTALLGDAYISSEFTYNASCGIILDQNYIGIDEEAVEDLNKLIVINVNKNVDYFKPVIDKYIVPIDALTLVSII